MDRRIEVVISKMEGQISKSWEIGELARLVNLSASRLRHLFKTETGKTPAQYLKYGRLQTAELLLRTTFLTVKEIANRVGLTTGSHFVREFKKIYGVAPTTYRGAPRLSTPARRSKPR
jgi:transcriptional regulator GlxA family with amidase domain